MIDKDNESYFLSKEEKEVIDNALSQISTIDLSEETKRLGVDIVDVVNKNFWKLLLKLDDEK